MRKTSIYFILLFITSSTLSHAQLNGKLNWSGYAEAYYNYDSQEPNNHERAGFLYNHKRHNELNLNLAMLKANYTDEKTRANIALMVGNYAQYNLAAENSIAQHIYEANVGVLLSKKNKIWLDAGIIPSHIGFESAIAQDCWTPSRSIVAENSPYYNSGIKLSGMNKKENFNYSVLVLNGWQQIQKLDGQQKPSFGLQLNYKTTKNITLNYSNYIGSPAADNLKILRTYHNMYAIVDREGKFNYIAGFDIGTQQQNGELAKWLTPVFISKYKIKSKNTIALRAEYFKDPNNIIINNSIGTDIVGMSLNYDYDITPQCKWRTEVKHYGHSAMVIPATDLLTATNFLTTLSIKF